MGDQNWYLDSKKQNRSRSQNDATGNETSGTKFYRLDPFLQGHLVQTGTFTTTPNFTYVRQGKVYMEIRRTEIIYYMKRIVASNNLLAYPYFNKRFDIHMYTSLYQLR